MQSLHEILPACGMFRAAAGAATAGRRTDEAHAHRLPEIVELEGSPDLAWNDVRIIRR